MSYYITVPLGDSEVGYIGFRPSTKSYFIQSQMRGSIGFKNTKGALDFIDKGILRLDKIPGVKVEFHESSKLVCVDATDIVHEKINTENGN